VSSSSNAPDKSASPIPQVVTEPAVTEAASSAPVVPPIARITGVAGGSRLAAVPSGSALAAPAKTALKSAAPLNAQPLVATAKPVGKLAAKPKAKSVSIANAVNIRPAVALARIRPRHRLLVASFALVVLLPILIAAAYLWGKAADQYASTVGFSVRREEAGSAMEMLGGLTGLTKSSSSDTDILYEYLRSQKLVADLDAKLNLRAIWSKPQGDPYFAFNPSGSVEDLLDYWQGMVSTSYDGSTGLIEVRVLAFDPADATRIATAVLDESARMINDLGAAAREDGVRFSREELDEAEDRLRSAREAITAFRVKNQIVDPTTDFQAQAGLVASLENQLASAQIEIDLLGDMASGDPRLLQAKRRVEVIETRIAAERAKVGVDTGVGQKDYAVLASDYERLAVDREFAERAYVASLAAYDTARAESQRTSRYLAPHILPTTAEVSRFPERLSILGLLALGLILAWSVTALMAYSLKDRR
jgi:capsular polysaccharide transport system permease protein